MCLKYAKTEYEFGNYEQAEKILSAFKNELTESVVVEAQLGKLNAQILLKNWDKAATTALDIKTFLRKSKLSKPQIQLYEQTLIVTGLFIVQFNLSSKSFLSELFSESVFLNKSLIRYYIVGALLNDSTLEIVDKVSWTQHIYADTFTTFIKTLHDDLDIEKSI